MHPPRALADFWRFRIRRLYWRWIEDHHGQAHLIPNHDLMQHEATNCWCGPKITLEQHDDGADCWHIEHHSLDAREGRKH